MHVPDIVWIVVEDDIERAAPVEQLLKRSRIPYVYLNTVTSDGLPSRFFEMLQNLIRLL